MTSHCTHLATINATATPSGTGCVECTAAGTDWVHLRMCRECGHVGCCDDSANKHASGHAASTGHVIASSFEPGETWWYCYQDLALFFRSTDPGYDYVMWSYGMPASTL